MAVVTAACDVVTDRYGSLQDARADQLFERGWLPDILPQSTFDIHTSNDLDTNISSGEFHFTPGDFVAFSEKLRPYSGRPSPLAYQSRDMQRLESKGYRAYEYSDDDSIWVFICKADVGVCEYRMWLVRN